MLTHIGDVILRSNDPIHISQFVFWILIKSKSILSFNFDPITNNDHWVNTHIKYII